MVCATLVALVVLVAVPAMNPRRAIYAQSALDGAHTLYLPVIMGGQSPAGRYHCLEYEFGLVWTSEVITLNPDGTSIYAYNPPSTGIVTGTWSYNASTREVGFTNFQWLTATYEMPDRLWATRYLPHAGFEVAIQCDRLKPTGMRSKYAG